MLIVSCAKGQENKGGLEGRREERRANDVEVLMQGTDAPTPILYTLPLAPALGQPTQQSKAQWQEHDHPEIYCTVLPPSVPFLCYTCHIMHPPVSSFLSKIRPHPAVKRCCLVHNIKVEACHSVILINL